MLKRDPYHLCILKSDGRRFYLDDEEIDLLNGQESPSFMHDPRQCAEEGFACSPAKPICSTCHSDIIAEMNWVLELVGAWWLDQKSYSLECLVAAIYPELAETWLKQTKEKTEHIKEVLKDARTILRMAHLSRNRNWDE